MAFLLLAFSTYSNLMYGVYFRKPATYFLTYFDETDTFVSAYANKEPAIYDFPKGVLF